MKRSDWSKNTGREADPNVELDRMFDALRTEDHSDSMPAVVAWLERHGRKRSDDSSIRRRRPAFFLKSHPALARSAAVVVVILALAVACQIPVDQEMSDGYFLQWTIDGPPSEATLLVNRYDWIDETRLSVSTADGFAETTLLLWLPGADEEQVDTLRDMLVADSANRAVAAYPVGHTARRPLYEAALRLVQIEIHSDGLSDAEIQEKIAAHLSAQGLTGYKIDYRDTNGQKKIEITLPPGDSDD